MSISSIYSYISNQHIVYKVDNEKDMKYLEKYLIAFYNTTNPKYGYNVSKGGDGCFGVPSATRKAIYQLDLKGNIIREWPSIMSVDKELDFDFRNISAALRGKRPTAYGYKWRYKN